VIIVLAISGASSEPKLKSQYSALKNYKSSKAKELP
jgi:hypothetical protein